MKIILTIAAFALAVSAQAAEFHVAKSGNDMNAGSASKPLLTIQAAAELAQPGDTITVHQGVYRERVSPPRGGMSDAQRIIYPAAPARTLPSKALKLSRIGNTWQTILGQSRCPIAFSATLILTAMCSKDTGSDHATECTTLAPSI